MKQRFLIVGMSLVLLLWLIPIPIHGQDECTGPSSPFPIPEDLSEYCTNDFIHDLSITPWDTTTYLSPDIRAGYTWTDSPADDLPRFFFYKNSSGQYCYYTPLFSRFLNSSGGIVCPNTPATGPASVSFSYKPATTAMDAYNAAPWVPIDTYTMLIPTGPGVLFPNDWHTQSYPVCWKQPPTVKFPVKFILKAQVNWGSEDPSLLTDNIAYSYYDLTPIKHDAQIAFSMDLSGSMRGSKMAMAKAKAQLFVTLIEDNQYLGVYGFATDNPANTGFYGTYTGTDNASHTENLVETTQIYQMTKITGALQRIDASNKINLLSNNGFGCTPIGQGLLRAKTGIDNTLVPGSIPPSKAIVLFSDGLQNVPPFVHETPTHTCENNTAHVNIDAAKTFADNNIPIYSIYFGLESGWGYDFMNTVKEQTGGKYVYGAATELELAEVYYSIRGMVDDMIYLDKKGETSANEPWPQFEVNFDNAVSVATVSAAWPLGNNETRLTVDRRQKGESQWIPNSYQNPPTARVATPNSFEVYRFAPGANTTWEFRVRQLSPREGNIKYVAAVFANVAEAQIRASMDDQHFAAGKPLPLYVDLYSGGYPIPGAKVTAYVDIPTRAFSSTLRKYITKFSASTTRPAKDDHRALTLAPQLQKFLKQDVGSDNLYPVHDLALTMKDNGVAADKLAGDGRFSVILPADQTRVAGVYKVTFVAEGRLDSGKPFKRVTILSTVCNVGPVDRAKSLVEVVRVGDSVDKYAVKIFPTDKFGNAAFPGSSRLITVASRNGELQGDIVDNQDSSFVQEVKSRDGKVPLVDVMVGGIVLGVTEPVKTFKRHEWSFHAGVAVPLGTFKNIAKKGTCLGLDYAYRFTPHLAVRWEAGLNNFKNSALIPKYLTLTHGNVYLQYRFDAGNIVPYIEAGSGYYKMKNGNSAAGFTGGVGLQFELTNSLNLDVNVHGHRVGGNLDLSFIRLLGGIIIKF